MEADSGVLLAAVDIARVSKDEFSIEVTAFDGQNMGATSVNVKKLDKMHEF